jgi:glutamyl/glutaminyl-tRNA synthetase
MAGPIAEVSEPVATLTRYAPAPTGYLHLGHVANAVWTWGLAASTGARVLLRIEDHDRQRCRPEYDEALLEDLEWLGFRADPGPVRQSDPDCVAAYAEALERLRADGLVYGCDCTRSTFAAWAEANGRSWTGAGCPGDCRSRGGSGEVPRVALGDGSEVWTDLLAGPCRGDVAPSGDLAIRDRHGNWTYGFCVVVDDLRQGVDLVVRGRDLLEATAGQIRLGRVLGRDVAPTFAHHELVRRPDGSKLSKSAGDTGVRELRTAGRSPAEVIELAAAATGYGASGG